MPIKKIVANYPFAGSIRRWRFTEFADTGEVIDIESSVSGEGDVLIRSGRGGSAAFIRKDELDEFIATLREASKMPCKNCDGKGYL